jgi:predicted flap endonuclease-1-like 5' DNA nuclease
MANIEDVEGIGPSYGEKLKAAGAGTTDALLSMGASPKGRGDLAEKTGISEKLILEWVNHVDLFRIKGVAGEYADLLEAAGVDSVPELAQRNAANLVQKLADTNETKKLVRRVPTVAELEDWISQAKSLPRIVTH